MTNSLIYRYPHRCFLVPSDYLCEAQLCLKVIELVDTRKNFSQKIEFCHCVFL